jgi:hypothetical protein
MRDIGLLLSGCGPNVLPLLVHDGVRRRPRAEHDARDRDDGEHDDHPPTYPGPGPGKPMAGRPDVRLAIESR